MQRKAAIIACASAAVAILAYQLLPPTTGGSGLEYVAIGIDEDHSPLVLGIQVKNPTPDDIELTGCSAQVLYSSLVAGDFTPETMPPSFAPKVTFVDVAPVVIPANSTEVVSIAFEWNLDDSLPPAAAACQIVPSLETEGGIVATEPVAFVVTHNAEGVKEAGGFRINASESSAREFLQSMENFDGKKSGRIQFLIKALRERLDGKTETLAPFI